MKGKFTLLLFLMMSSIPCFAARCLQCGRNLAFADNDKVCNICLAKNAIKARTTMAKWEINYKRNLAKPGIRYIIYSARNSFENRVDAVYISDEGKLIPIHYVYWEVQKHILNMPAYNNPDRVNICFYYPVPIKGSSYPGFYVFFLGNMPLTVGKYNYLKFEVGLESNNTLRVDIWGGQYRYDGFTRLGSGTIGPGKMLDCSSLN